MCMTLPKSQKFKQKWQKLVRLEEEVEINPISIES